MDSSPSAAGEAEESVRGRADDIAAILADRIGRRAGVGAIFGDPVERDGITVIPVGRMRWGFGGGGGGGAHADETGEGSGGGGGVMAAPAGYIEITDGKATFTRIGFPVSPGGVIAVAVAFYLAMRGLRAVLR